MQSGKCDLAIGNTYYMALMMTNEKNPEQKDWAAAVKLLFPNASDRGTHVNISGMALAKHAPNKDNADQADGIPGLRRGAEDLRAAEQRVPGQSARSQPSDIVKGFGTLKPDTLPLENIAKYRKKASEIMDKVQLRRRSELLISARLRAEVDRPSRITARAICISGPRTSLDLRNELGFICM